jgi:hypothetical protein
MARSFVGSPILAIERELILQTLILWRQPHAGSKAFEDLASRAARQAPAL